MMGVLRFNYTVKSRLKKAHVNYQKKFEYYFLDGNCLLHECINELLIHENPYTNIREVIKKVFLKQIVKNESDKYYIIFDGIPPLIKQSCQKKRRIEKDNLNCELLPCTPLMKTIEKIIVEEFVCDYIFLSKSSKIGEGEQKIIKTLRKEKIKSDVLIYSLDSDMIILSQILQYQLKQINLFVTIPSFDIFIDIKKLNDIFFKNRKFDIEKFLLFCFICGNDFIPTHREVTDNNKLYSMFCKEDVCKFSDLSIDICVFNCESNKVDFYIKIWEWYIEYFTTNENLDCEDYPFLDTPCFFCISNKKGKYTKKVLDYTYEKHINYVYPNLLNKKEILKLC